MSKFNVTRVTGGTGFLHHRAFDDIQASLEWALSSLSHSVTSTFDWFSEHNETNLIFGPELMADFTRVPANSILYVLEQPSHPRVPVVQRIAKESDCIVWHYSQRGVEEWRTAGIEKVVHVPIGYTPNLTRLPVSSADGSDIFFAGWLTERRREIIEALHKSGLNIFSSAACYGGARDELISRSKLCLNLHHDGRDRFEIVRCSFLMANSKCVVTEPSADDDEYQHLERGLVKVPARLLVDYCHSLLSSPSERLAMEEKALDAIRSRSYAEAIAAALDTAIPAPTPPVPAISRPLEFKLERKAAKEAYLAEGRDLSTAAPSKVHDSRVAARYSRACAEGDMKDFAPWLRSNAHGNVVEIGVRDGASTSAFLAGIEDTYGHLYSIDIQPCGHLFSGHPQWTFIQADSKDHQKVIKQLPFEIDLLLIDGDHSMVGVQSDLIYAQNLRPGGLVAFHDTKPEPRPADCNDMGWPGDDVKSVYEDLCHNMAPLGWTHFDVPGKYGLGVLRRPQPDPAVTNEPRAEDKVSVAFVKAYAPDVKRPIREELLKEPK